MRALGFEIKKREVIALVRQFGKGGEDVVNFDEFLQVESLSPSVLAPLP